MTTIIRRTRILTTNRVVYTAWEPGDGQTHSTVSLIAGHSGWYGKIGTKSFSESERDRARDLIYRACPGLLTAHFTGRVTIDGAEIVVDPYRFDEDGELIDIVLT